MDVRRSQVEVVVMVTLSVFVSAVVLIVDMSALEQSRSDQVDQQTDDPDRDRLVLVDRRS